MINGWLAVKNGIYHTVVSYPDKSGKRKEHWKTTRLPQSERDEANILLKKRVQEAELRLGCDLSGPCDFDPSFAEYMQSWLEIIKPTIQITTYASYHYIVNQCVTPYFSQTNFTLQSLTTIGIQLYYNSLLSRGLKTNTVIKHHANIHAALEYAYRMGFIRSNPAGRIPPLKRERQQIDYYKAEELLDLLKAAEHSSSETPVMLSIFYGLRRSEALGLKWNAVDFIHKTLTIRHTVCSIRLEGKQKTICKDQMKNAASTRTYPLLPNIEQRLHQVLELQQMRCTGKHYCKDYLDYVCVHNDGRLLRPEYLSSHFKLLLERNELRQIRYHALRHSCASLLVQSGTPMKEIQEWMGHGDFSSTANLYGHLEFKTKGKTANRMLLCMEQACHQADGK